MPSEICEDARNYNCKVYPLFLDFNLLSLRQASLPNPNFNARFFRKRIKERNANQTRAQDLADERPNHFRTICATGTAVGWRCPACHPQKTTGSPTQTSLLVTPPASPPPSPPGFPQLLPGFYQSRPPRGPPRYPCSICSLEVGKDSLKCSTCSKWVHFSCSSLTRADFRKICAAGSPMG